MREERGGGSVVFERRKMEIAGSDSPLFVDPQTPSTLRIYPAENALAPDFLWKRISEFTTATFFEEKSPSPLPFTLVLGHFMINEEIIISWLFWFNGRENGGWRCLFSNYFKVGEYWYILSSVLDVSLFMRRGSIIANREKMYEQEN